MHTVGFDEIQATGPDVTWLSRTWRLAPLVLAMAGWLPSISTAATAAPAAQTASQATLHRFHADHVLGTSFELLVNTPDAAHAERAYQVALAEIARLDQHLSTWRSDSEINQLHAQKQAVVSEELFEVIAACEAWRDQTCGAFDARLGQLIGAWEQAHDVHQLDEPTRVALLDQLRRADVLLDHPQQQITLAPHTKLAIDGYAKGYIIDKVLLAIRHAVPQVQGALVDIGGDLRVFGQSAQAQGWQVGVRAPFARHDNAQPDQVLQLSADQAVAFSGQGARFLANQSHLLDPATGLPANHVEQCVVVGRCAADADALATALVALPADQGMRLIEQLVGYEAQLVQSDGQIRQSSGWSVLVQPRTLLSGNEGASAVAAWPAKAQAQIELTLPKIAVSNYRAPYVAVWITDAQKQLVRTLAVWGKAEKWIDSNYVWWRRYGRKMDQLDSVAQPSRQAGQYRLLWDGLDDAGQKVAQGQYTLHIETSREHGEHTYQSMDLPISTQGVQAQLPAQTEIGAIKLKFLPSL